MGYDLRVYALRSTEFGVSIVGVSIRVKSHIGADRDVEVEVREVV